MRARGATLAIALLLAIGLVAPAAIAAPAAPKNLEASPAVDAATLSWTAPGGSVTGYRIEQSTDGGSTWKVLVSDTGNPNTARRVTGLTEGARYHFRVRALDGATVGSPSAGELAIPCRYIVAGREYSGWTAPCWSPPSGHPFKDISKSWQHQPVSFLVANDITYGTSPTEYSPDDPVTRGQMAAFLWRLADRPTGYPNHGFTDVTKSWQQEPIRWMKAEGITQGTSATEYSPDDPVTRGQMAAFLWRLVDTPWGHAGHVFGDITKSWQEHAVRWLADTAITQGVSSSRYAPNDDVTRGQMAAFLYRLATNTFKSRTYFGTGDNVFNASVPANATAIARISHRGSENIIVEGFTSDGDWDLLVNEIGNYSGIRPMNFNAALYAFPTSRLEVDADGFWTIVIMPLNDARTLTRNGGRAGVGDDFLVLPGTISGRTEYSHTGSSNFVVWALDASYWGYDLQVNEIGNYSGADYLPAGSVALDVVADGSWTINHTP